MIKKQKETRIFFILAIVLLTITTGITFSKYTKKINVATIDLNVTALEYWEAPNGSGFQEGTFSVIVNTERTLILELMGKSRSR